MPILALGKSPTLSQTTPQLPYIHDSRSLAQKKRYHPPDCVDDIASAWDNKHETEELRHYIKNSSNAHDVMTRGKYFGRE